MSRPLATNPLRNKPVAVIGASTGMFGAVWAQAELRKVLAAIGARVADVDTPVPQIHEQFDDNGDLVNDELRDAIEDATAQLCSLVTDRERVRTVAEV